MLECDIRNLKMTKMVYGTYDKTGKYILTYSKAEARKISINGIIRALSYGYYKDCHFSMDYPTFIAVSDLL